MTLDKDLPRKKRAKFVKPEKPAPRFPWLLPLFIIVAVGVLIWAVIEIIHFGIPLF
jgi:hypothetical protein